MREASRTVVSVTRLYSSHLQLPNYLTYSAGHFEEMQNTNLGGFMPLIHVMWDLDKYFVDCGNADDDTPAMAVKITRRTKEAVLAVSAIKQKDLSNDVGDCLQHAIIMRYSLEDDQVEHGVTGASWDTQEQWLLRGIPLRVLDSDRGHKGHQKWHAAEAAQEQIVSEAPVDDSESTAPKPAPTLPKLKKTAQDVPTRGTAAGKGAPSSSKKQAKEKGKEPDKAEETDNEDGDKEEEHEDLDQVLETQQKRKRAPASHFDASPDDSGKDQPKKKFKTAASASAEFKLPSHSGAQQSRSTVASPRWRSSVARSLSSKLAKVARPKKK